MKARQIQGHRAAYDKDLWPWRGHSMTYIWLRRPSNRFTFVDHPNLSRLRAATRRLSGSGSVRALVYINTWLCHLGVGCSITGSPRKRQGVSLRKWEQKRTKKRLRLTKVLEFLCWHGLRYRIEHNHTTLSRSWRHYGEFRCVISISLFVGEGDDDYSDMDWQVLEM